MTVCFVAAVPGIVLAAADTRITLHLDRGASVNDDGPRDLRVDVASLGRTVVFPYRQRKIRFLGAGWAVVAGEFASGTLLLDELRDAGAARFERAQAHVDQVRHALEERALRDTGVATEQLRKTLVIAADLTETGGAWVLGVNPSDSRSQANPGQFIVNTPLDIPDAVWAAAKQFFHDELGASIQAQNAIGLVKAAARLVGVAGVHSKEASARAQIGVTIKDPGGGHVARYFDGPVEALLRLTPADFFPSSEPATT